MFYVYLCNEEFEGEANGFVCNINHKSDITDDFDHIDREVIDRNISPVARFKKDQWNCSDDFMKRNQCKKDALLD